jgi:uncharacterized lipoprotein YmbA
MPFEGSPFRPLAIATAAATLIATLSSSGSALAGSSGSGSASDAVKLRDKNGRVTGSITPDTFVDGRWRVRDRNGRVTATIEDGKARDRSGRSIPLSEVLRSR